MTTPKNEASQSTKIGRWLLTALLWLATLALGFFAFIALQDIVLIAGAQLIARNDEIGVVEGRGWLTTGRNVITMCGGILWLALAVGGMEYHFRRAGQRRSLVVLGWTIGIELAIIAIGALLRTSF